MAPDTGLRKKHTEGSMLALLEKRYCGQESGSGPAWALVPQVRNAAGFNATRTIDALAMSLWPSRGLELHGHEIKVSRSDWLRELKDPSKAEAFCMSKRLTDAEHAYCVAKLGEGAMGRLFGA